MALVSGITSDGKGLSRQSVFLELSRGFPTLRQLKLYTQALGVLLGFVLSLSWVEISDLGVQQKTEYWVSLFVSILAALCLSLLLVQEQRGSDRVSDLTTLYLLASTLCDVIILAAPSSVIRHAHISHTVLVNFCIHSTILLLEYSTRQPKPSNGFSASPSPEERHGVLGRVFFIWINPILFHGYTNILVNQDLPNLGHDMKPEATREAIITSWSQRS